MRRLRTKKVHFDNRVSCLFLPLGTEIKENVKRLEAIAKEMHRLKSGSQIGVQYFLEHVFMGNLPTACCRSLQFSFVDTCSLLYSNIPGIREKIYFGGARVISCFGFTPLIGTQGIALASCSYDNRIVFAVMTDKEKVKHPKVFCDFFLQTYQEMLLECGVKDEVCGPLRGEGSGAPLNRKSVAFTKSKSFKAGSASSGGPSTIAKKRSGLASGGSEMLPAVGEEQEDTDTGAAAALEAKGD